jgi:hypothetical protein
MSGQMCWLASFGSDDNLILHLRLDESQPWQPYTLCRQYAVPDYPIPRGSKGWATYQKLLKAGWKILPNPRKEPLPYEPLPYVSALQFVRS